MEIYTATHYLSGLDDPHAADIGTFFWGALILLALFVSCFLLWNAIVGRGNRDHPPSSRRRLTGGPPKAPRAPEVQDSAISWNTDLFAEPWLGGGVWQQHMDGMNRREQEEFLLARGPKQVRKAIQEHRQAREEAHKKGGGTS